MNAICHFCGATHWVVERVEGQPTSPTFSHCCHHGKVILHLLLTYRRRPCPFVPFLLTKLLKHGTFDGTFDNTTAALPSLLFV